MAISPLDQIKKHQESIAALTADAVASLKAERASLENQVREIDAQISQLTGKPPGDGVTKTRKPRSPSVHVFIEDIVKHIKAGVKNNNALSKATGASPAKIKAIVAVEGKKAGITSTGSRSKFEYALK